MIWKRDDLSRRTAWTKADIRSARQVHLKPILETLGYRLRPLTNGNYDALGLPKHIVIKDNYWLCKDDQTAGNSIDLCTNILNMSFHQAMTVILGRKNT